MSENENNFESVRRLLALKRHEIPPPGYFDNFSRSVAQKIRENRKAQAGTLFGVFGAQLPWLEKLVQAIYAKPVFASGFAGALCVMLFLAVISGERTDVTASPQLPGYTAANTASLAALSPAALTQPMNQPGIVSSTNPVLSLQAIASPYAQPNPLAQPVGFSLPGN